MSTSLWRLAAELRRTGYTSGVIVASKDTVELDSQTVDIDLAQFRKLAPGAVAITSAGGLMRALECVRLYKGDLLEDWDVEWCRLEREDLRRRYIDIIQAVGNALENRGRLDLALTYARRAAEADPLNEVVQRNLIRLLYKLGNRSAAVAQFNLFSRLCRSELGVEPDPETLALRYTLASPRTNAASGLSAGPGSLSIRLDRAPIIGRASEKAAISRIMESAVAGRGGSGLLLGDVGIGKSRIVDWAVEEWIHSGGVLGQGRCIEFNEPVRYQPVLDALGQLLETGDMTALVQLRPPTEHRIDGDGRAIGHAIDCRAFLADKTWLFAKLMGRLETAAKQRPILLVFEDTQWADTGTIDFLCYALSRIRSRRMGMILTSRPGGSWQSCKDAERVARNCTFVLRLTPLSREETAEFAQFLLGHSPLSTQLSEWLYDETEGNPLFIVETVRLLQQKGLETASLDPPRNVASGPQGRGDPFRLPEGVRAAVEQRLALLESTAHRLAQIASVLGRSFSEELLEMVAGVGGKRLSRALAQLIVTGIFERESGGVYKFAHDKIRAICYESLSQRDKRAYHARTAAVLAQVSGVPMQSLAWHQHSAAQWGLASESWELAGDQAKSVYAFKDAAGAYRNGIMCLQRDRCADTPRSRLREALLLFKLDEVLANHGSHAEWEEVLDRLGLLCRRLERRDLVAAWYLRKAVREEYLGNYRLAVRLARRSWYLAKTGGESSAEVEALRILAWVLNRAGRHDRSMLVSRLVIVKIGDSRTASLVVTLWQAAAVHLKQSNYDAAATLLERAESVALEIGLRRELHHIAMLRGIIDKWTGRIESSKAGLLRALELAAETSDQVGVARGTFHLATLDTLSGALGVGLRRLRRAIVASRSVGYTRTYLACLNEVAYGIGRILGNYDWARRALSHALALAEHSKSIPLIAMCKDSQAALLLDEDRPEEALVVIDDVLHLLGQARGSMGPNQESLARRGVSLLRIGRIEDALHDLEEARLVQAKKGDRLVLIDTLTWLGIAHLRSGHADRALAASDEALHLLVQSGYANMQPQRMLWHHFLIMEELDQQPRLSYLERAVRLIEMQAATLSVSQRARFCRKVAVNKAILDAWAAREKATTVLVMG